MGKLDVILTPLQMKLSGIEELERQKKKEELTKSLKQTYHSNKSPLKGMRGKKNSLAMSTTTSRMSLPL